MLREIGVPVEARLARSKLPGLIEQTPDEYVSIPPALEFIAECGRDLHLSELAYLASAGSSIRDFSAQLLQAVVSAPTGYARIEALTRVGHHENSTLAVRMAPDDGDVRIVCAMSDFDRNPFLCLAEWLNLLAVVSIIRGVVGATWCPSEMTFASRQPPSEAALEAFGNTRILVGQPCCSLVVDANVLATPAPRDDTKAALVMLADAKVSEGWTLVDALRSVVRPYLGEGYPDVARSAEIVGMSKRTLQRRLELAGCSYSKVVQQARFELARGLLCDPSIKVIDIAFETGYQNPQHFARSFRQMAGVSPSSYRRHVTTKPVQPVAPAKRY